MLNKNLSPISKDEESKIESFNLYISNSSYMFHVIKNDIKKQFLFHTSTNSNSSINCFTNEKSNIINEELIDNQYTILTLTKLLELSEFCIAGFNYAAPRNEIVFYMNSVFGDNFEVPNIFFDIHYLFYLQELKSNALEYHTQILQTIQMLSSDSTEVQSAEKEIKSQNLLFDPFNQIMCSESPSFRTTSNLQLLTCKHEMLTKQLTGAFQNLRLD